MKKESLKEREFAQRRANGSKSKASKSKASTSANGSSRKSSRVKKAVDDDDEMSDDLTFEETDYNDDEMSDDSTFEETDYIQQTMKKQHVYEDTDRDLIYFFTDGRVQINSGRNVYVNWEHTMEDFKRNNPEIKVKLVGKFIVTEDNDVFETISKRSGINDVGHLLNLNPFYGEETVFDANALVIIPE